MEAYKLGRFRLVIFIVVLLSASLLIVSGMAKSRSRVIRKASPVTSGRSQTPEQPNQATAQRPRPLAQIEAELITITPHGFEPAEFSRSQGRFLLMVDNRGGLNNLSLQLRHEGGTRIVDISTPREEPNWSGVIDPPPGEQQQRRLFWLRCAGPADHSDSADRRRQLSSQHHLQPGG